MHQLVNNELWGLCASPDLTLKERHIWPTQISDVEGLRRLCFVDCKCCEEGELRIFI